MAAAGGDKVSFEVGRDSRDVRFSFCGDRFGNDRTFEYDSLGRLVKASRRASGERTVEPVASFAYGKGREPVAVSLLDEKGQPAVTTKITRDAAGRPVAIDDGRGKREVSYNRFGYPTEIKDVFGNVTKLCYNILNVPVKTIDANGIVTEYKYSDSGLVWFHDRLSLSA